MPILDGHQNLCIIIIIIIIITLCNTREYSTASDMRCRPENYAETLLACCEIDLKAARKQALIGGQDEHLPHGQ